MNFKDISTKIAQYLLQCQAVKLNVENPFTWTSGLRSPIYCDNRVTLSYPEIRNYITQSLVFAIKENYPSIDAITGVATAGIAQGALVADMLNLPFAYIRPEPKKHGMKNSIEGHLEPGSKVVVVEDLISTGKSSLKAVADLRENQIQVIGLVSIFNYGFAETFAAFTEKQCPFTSLCNFNELSNQAKLQSYLTDEQYNKITSWNKSAMEWSENYLKSEV